jgi:hypothetical protein
MLTDAARGENSVCMLDFSTHSRTAAIDSQQAEESELARQSSDKV